MGEQASDRVGDETAGREESPQTNDPTSLSPSPASVLLSVNIGTDTQTALADFIALYGVSLTEALRRLVAYGDFVAREIHAGHQVLVRDGDEVREVTLL
jgi:hypothetical protein